MIITNLYCFLLFLLLFWTGVRYGTIDHHDFLLALNSWRCGESAAIHHEEIFWNACVELMKVSVRNVCGDFI